ncbi:MAG: hypothetical protein ACLQGP_13585 [Isosphaeraceae bacterium]
MARFRLQFKLRQLIKLVALAAVIFALFRTFAGLFVLAIGLLLAGFVIDLARGGKGVLGSMLAGMLGFFGFGAVAFVYDRLFVGKPDDWIISPYALLLSLSLAGLILGVIFGICAWLLVILTSRLGHPYPRHRESCGPIYWRSFDDPQEATRR